MQGQGTPEKWMLLGALYQHGTDTEKLNDVLPNWNSYQINAAIRRYKTRAAKELSSKRDNSKPDPIDEWYDLIKNCHLIEGTSKQSLESLKVALSRRRSSIKGTTADNYSFLLSKIFMHAACFEQHYESENPDDPNYSEIYRYLSLLLKGKEVPQLRPGSAAKVIQMLSLVKDVLNDEKNMQQYINYFENLDLPYLNPHMTPEEACELRKERNNCEIAATNTTSLFEDEQESVCFSDLEAESPNYVSERDSILKKLTARQRSIAENLAKIPGLNPLEVPVELLSKPQAAFVKGIPFSSKQKP